MWLLLAVLQLPPKQPSQPAADAKTSVVLTGCIAVPEFKVTKGELVEAGATVRLKARKNVMALLKEHNGHQDELTGLLDESGKAMGGTKEKNVGANTRVYVGAREERDPDTPRPAGTLDVRTLRHLDDRCPALKLKP